MYAHTKNRLYVNLFVAGEGTVKFDDGRVVKLVQDTNYPWEGKVTLRVLPEQSSDFDLCVRVPGWAIGKPVPSDIYRFDDPTAGPVTLTVNGDPVEVTPGEDGYVHLKRSWKRGDVVALDLPMPVRRVYAHEKIEANIGKVALMRGPVVYCLEGVDNKGIDLFKLALPQISKLNATHRPDLLGGVTVLEGKAVDADAKPVQLIAVPYHAWANREKGPMTIWINEAE